jgi:ubiquinone/menaquinone biosynthesis C-methylase UbiE
MLSQVDVRDLPGTSEGFAFTVYDGTVLPYADSSVDMAVALMSLHHCENASETIAEVLITITTI